MSPWAARRGLAAPLLGFLLLSLLPALPGSGGFLVRAAAAGPVGGIYHPLTPVRILDTRTGTGGVPVAPMGQGGTLDVQVAGRGSVPASGVSAAVINVTAADTTAPGYLTVYPAGVTRPLASNLNWTPGQTVPNLVVVGLGTGGTVDGKVTVYNGSGSANVIFDVAGYYDQSAGPDGLFNPLVASRLLDTRTNNPGPIAKIGQNQKMDLQVTGRGGVPATGAEAVVLNVTATNPSTSGYLTVWPTGTAMPLSSNLNFKAGQTVPNRVSVGLGTGGQVSIYNGQGSTDVVTDVNGWFTDATVSGTGSRYTPVTPARVLDSRTGAGGFVTPWGPDSGRAVTVAGQGGVPLMTDPNPPTAVIANVTVTATTSSGGLVAWPHPAARPLASDLNWPGGTTAPNLVVVQVGPTGSVDLYNMAGCADVIVDVVGWFTGPPPLITTATPPVENPCPGWLTRLNFFRATAGLPPVTENGSWSGGDSLHGKWMVKNQTIMHGETLGSPYYTTAGDLAGQNGNIAVSSTTTSPNESAIDWWMAAPFHAIAMMDPRFQQTGFGAYREVRSSGWEAGFALDTSRGNTNAIGAYANPVFWPGNGATVPLRTYSGNESPNPLQACAGYSGTVGLPVFIEVGGNVSTTTGPVHTFTGNGTPLAHCVIDSQNPTFTSYLKWRGAVIVIPKAPLVPGVTYVVTLTVNGVPRTWTFSVS